MPACPPARPPAHAAPRLLRVLCCTDCRPSAPHESSRCLPPPFSAAALFLQ